MFHLTIGVRSLRIAKLSYLKAVGVRLLAGIPVFLLVTFSATALSSLMPGSAAQLILGENATQAQIDALNSRYGYDLPVWERYLGWLGRLLQGDLGQTMFSQQSVAKLLVDRAAVTFEIALLAMFVSLLIGVPLAMYTASRPGGIVDTVLRAVSSVMLSIPTFVIVVLLGFVFAIVLRWLPATGWVSFSDDPIGNLYYVALPVMCLSVHQAAYFYRVSRSEFVAVLQEDYVLVARAKGLPTRYILMRHVLRPASPQVLTVMGLSMTYLLGGSFIVESYFAVPGIGWTVLNAVSSHDLPVMQAILSLTVVIFVVIFILVDLGYALIDPRVDVS
ncbi:MULTISPECIES: ABC transporter permease [Rhizobium]|jgi:peptide/nickel transport system permease protein|uniref:ABC transporter permease n=1 Tax=Rhizobium leguminosarum TaxID=384 RepID=A0A6B3JLN1_RHILE|nr:MULTISPECIES: ABC transporter permease [Rhizobium]QJS29687.1 ABC transporter permease [Rhizobium leguminosarum bv. trifolii TA1]MBY5833867.1 ABC transporter permease [Rhizobium leguminosarum]MBY5862110.1 ABC transporter permease [Rhizobium leguminosarum]MBY5876554.1 ABC transporter permease [Rhizobium leguminosarum]MCJ9693285.1 ABC transporter permease [Rhizobium sp. PRIMUS64]